jgi:hypothetical protein
VDAIVAENGVVAIYLHKKSLPPNKDGREQLSKQTLKPVV